MSLKTLTEDQKAKQLDAFLAAPPDQNFGHEVVALYLDCSTWTLARMRCNGSDLPYAKIGRRVVYKKADVLAFVKSRTVNCTAEYA